MTKTVGVVAVCVAAASLSACGTIKPDPVQISATSFAPAPTDDEVMAAVRTHERAKLKDPYSAIYECGRPRKAWTNVFGRIIYGWAVACTVNAKNSFGAYIGAQPRGYLFQGPAIVQDAWANIGYVE